MEDNRMSDIHEAINQLYDPLTRRNAMLILYKLSKRDLGFFNKLDRITRSKIIELLEEAVEHLDVLAFGALLDLFPSPETFDWIAQHMEKQASLGHGYVVRDVLYCCSIHPEMIKEAPKMLKTFQLIKKNYPKEVEEIFSKIGKIDKQSS